MATIMHIQNMPQGYAGVVRGVMTEGAVSSPRGKLTIEMQDVTIKVDEPWYALPIGTGRKLNVAIGAVEALQLIAGTARPRLLLQVSPHFKQYFEGNRMYGMYGERIANQLNSVVQKLCDDPDTRQAIITLWRPDWDNDAGHKDYPCTIGMQFRIRDDLLRMSTIMRSNDVILGFAYDVFQFTQLQLSIANLLGLGCGPYVHHAFSLHLYQNDVQLVDELRSVEPTLPLHGITGADVWDLRERARKLLDNIPLERPSTTERWYREQLDRVLAHDRA